MQTTLTWDWTSVTESTSYECLLDAHTHTHTHTHTHIHTHMYICICCKERDNKEDRENKNGLGKLKTSLTLVEIFTNLFLKVIISKLI